MLIELRRKTTKDLAELRVQLDQIDSQIVKLYEDRMDLCRQVGEDKLKTGKRILDKEREKQKIQAVSALAHNDFNRTGISELFEQIMAMSRKLQYQIINEKGGQGNLPFFAVDKLDTDKIRVVFQGRMALIRRQQCIHILEKKLTAFM